MKDGLGASKFRIKRRFWKFWFYVKETDYVDYDSGGHIFEGDDLIEAEEKIAEIIERVLSHQRVKVGEDCLTGSLNGYDIIKCLKQAKIKKELKNV